jgi:hypothetical protein
METLNKSILDFSALAPKNLVGAQLCCAMIARHSRAPTVFRGAHTINGCQPLMVAVHPGTAGAAE